MPSRYLIPGFFLCVFQLLTCGFASAQASLNSQTQASRIAQTQASLDSQTQASRIAQTQASPFAGNWSGKLNVGVELTIVFHIVEAAGKLTATADSPDQNAFGLQVDTVTTDAGGIRMVMNALRASFEGRLSQDSLLEGQFIQGQAFPLVLKRTTGAVLRKTKPQEPVAPFPYEVKELTYKGGKTGLTYGGTLTIPKGPGPFPAAVLITGSGAQDRDEFLMGHRPFAVLADALTRNGVIVLRVDDRGVGQSSGNFGVSTSADFAKDVSESFDFLLTQPGVDRKRAGLIGHSEGGMIAPMVAATRKDLGFVILLAAPGIPVRDLMAEQTIAVMKAAGVPDTAARVYERLYSRLMDQLVTTADSAKAMQLAQATFRQWVSSTDPAILASLGLDDSASRSQILAPLAAVARGPWFRSFYRYDPAPNLRQLYMKVLALNGEKDVQVISSSNLAGVRKALEASRTKDFETRELPGLNHLFQQCSSCAVGEYATLEETFSPAALQVINDWISRKVR